MAFLRLNGITVPVRSPKLNFEEIGDGQVRAFSGELLTDRRALKRRWEFETTPLDEAVAKAIEGIIQGLGHVFHYDDGDNAYADFSKVDQFSTKGLGPSTGIGNGFFRFNAGETGGYVPVYDGNDVEEARHGTGALEVAGAVTNLLAANVSDGSDTNKDTTNWSAVAGGSVASSANLCITGTQSMRVAVSASGDGGRQTGTIGVSGADHTFSVYLLSNATKSVRVRMTGDVSGAHSTTKTVTALKWYRLQVTADLTADSTVYVEILSNDTGSFNIYVDCLQLEENSLATPWKHSASARTAGSLDYGTAFTDYKNFTICCWVKAPASSSGAQYIFRQGSSATAGSQLQLYRNNNDLVFDCSAIGLSITDTTSAAFDDDWHMITAVLSQSADGSTYNKAALYVDGALVGSDNTLTAVLDLSAVAVTAVGNRGDGANVFAGALEELMVLPYAMTPTQIAALYAMMNTDGEPMSDLPRLYMDGDVVPDPEYSIQVVGTVRDVTYLSANAGSAWENNKRIISFTLREA